MHISIILHDTPEISLPAISALKSLSESELYNRQKNLRHPLAIYKNSLSTALTSIENLTKATREILFSKSDETISTAKEATKTYIQDTFTHIEDCKAIIKTIYSHTEEKELQKSIRKFSNSISSFRDCIATQANKIKHNQSEIRIISFDWSNGFAPGYYVESIINGDTLGPDPEIHPRSNSAFSYAREIRKSICGILFISRELAGAIETKIKSKTPQEEYSHPKISSIAKMLALYFDYYFPDEILKPNPRVEKKENTTIITMPSKHRPKCMPQQTRVTTTLMSDGFTRSFALPYFRGDS